jgi:hypothetical protein
MDRITRRRNVNKFLIGVVPLAVIGIVVAASLGLGGLFGGAGRGEASSVQVLSDGQVVFTGDVAGAAAKVTDQVGFPVRVPTDLPTGFSVVTMAADTGPAGVAGFLNKAIIVANDATASANATAAVTFEETGSPFGAPTDRAEKFDVGVVGVTAFTQKTDAAVGYWLFTKDRGFLVTITGDQSRLGHEEILATLRSLVR